MKNFAMVLYGGILLREQAEEIVQKIWDYFNFNSPDNFSKSVSGPLLEKKYIRVLKVEATNYFDQGLIDVNCSFSLSYKDQIFLQELVSRVFKADPDYFYFIFPQEDRIPRDEIRYKKIGGIKWWFIRS